MFVADSTIVEDKMLSGRLFSADCIYSGDFDAKLSIFPVELKRYIV